MTSYIPTNSKLKRNKSGTFVKAMRSFQTTRLIISSFVFVCELRILADIGAIV